MMSIVINYNRFYLEIEKRISSHQFVAEKRIRLINKIFADINKTDILNDDYSTTAFEDTEDEINAELAINSETRIKEKQLELGITPDDPPEKHLDKIKLPYGRSRLHEAVIMQDIQFISQFLSEGEDPSATDNNGNTPYDLALLNNYVEVIALLEKKVPKHML